jgi:hypothetical protein
MRAMRAWPILLAGWVAGCASTVPALSERRPAPLPSPDDVQQEIRDARYFLAYPLEDFLPGHGFRPGIGAGVTTYR